ncbi:DUF6895 family protein [Streptomyces sp. NPDC059152]|uniref:DUF6895 family protein n=1 Tax=Streptomyces sp. NPDC059152 TaxID=3346742 RepID=UPI0036B3F4A9
MGRRARPPGAPPPPRGRGGGGGRPPPPPHGSVPETGAAPRPTDPAEAFLACYHSTLVTAFAGTLARIASDEAGAGPVRAGDAAAVAGRTPIESEAAL